MSGASAASSTQAALQHTLQRLPLLPPGPDGVHVLYVAQDPDVHAAFRSRTSQGRASEREFRPAVADCRFRAPLSPRVARPVFNIAPFWIVRKVVLPAALQIVISAPSSLSFPRSLLRHFRALFSVIPAHAGILRRRRRPRRVSSFPRKRESRGGAYAVRVCQAECPTKAARSG